jgi:hypothetical protein
VQLSRGGPQNALSAEHGVVLVYLGVDDEHDEVQVDPQPAHLCLEVLTKSIVRLTTVRDELRRLDG